MSTSPSPVSRRQSRGTLAAIDSSSERSLESLALSVGALSFVVSAAVALLSFRFAAAPIAGPNSVGQFAAVASAVTVFLAFVAGRYLLHASAAKGRVGFLDVVDVVALGFAHAVIALLTWTLLAVIMEQAFIGAEVFPLAVLILAGAAAALSAYLAFYSATHMDLQLLAIVLAVFLTEGVIASMLTASDPQWWKENLSALGMTDDLSAMAFNLTLIVAGVLVTTLARSATKGIPTPHPTGLRSVRTCLVVVGVFLGLVGVFPVDQFFALHTAVASGMVVAFAVLIVRLNHWIPGMPRVFIMLGWLFVAVIVLLAVFFAVGFYTLTAVELVAGILVFTWIVLFIRNAAALEQDAAAAASLAA
ncbi:DUF998 domain-containing protein [Microbacterium terricola]|uniref:DUF998 domain-containing protein n=1 Tax=Microbacterium terricola TaxID=344163 RepID=A0ABM8E3A3_9MICO|nr:DUF998 domain-containing protein [Microbacterium terricola]UYK40107.1 DUF998 domain-containing protein [Microbacterium terricola]BDV32191.1 hypothetical protein Microterr_28510 [Microbacterium terricola]